MKVLLPLVVLVILAQSVQAQWLSSSSSTFDRAKPRYHRLNRTLSLPVEEPNWIFPNVNVTSAPDQDQTEPSVAVNPLDSLNIIVSANDDRNFDRLWVYSSTDGGTTWVDKPMPQPAAWVVGATDPSVSFDAEGFAFIMYGEYGHGSENDVIIYRSIDKGVSWQPWSRPFADTVSATSISDKYYLAFDNSSFSSDPNVFATWIDETVGDTLNRVVVSSSTIGGKPWTPRTYLTGLGIFSSPIPAAGGGGLNIAYNDHQVGHDAIYVSTDEDPGIKIGTYVNLGPVLPFDGFGNPTNNGYPCITGDSKGPLLVNSFPSIACDAIFSDSRNYLVWCGKDSEGTPHVWYSYPDGIQLHWSTPRTIDGDSVGDANSRFFPWIATDPKTGNVAVVYYVSRAPDGHLVSDLFMSHSTDQGDTWHTRRITSASSLPTSVRDVRDDTLSFFGDYINVAGLNNTWHPVWTDARTEGDAEIYSATVQPFAPMPVSDLQLHDTTIDGHSATAITWNYSAETTFGYPLIPPYIFIVQKGSSFDTLSFTARLDTATDSAVTYKVWVRANGYNSIVDSVSRDRSVVAVDPLRESVSISLSGQPAIQGKAETFSIVTENPCSVFLRYYDELGREVGQTQDGELSSAHSIRFTPEILGVTYYTIRGVSASGVWQRTGRLLTLPGE